MGYGDSYKDFFLCLDSAQFNAGALHFLLRADA
jgi:hypothetical protein